MIKVILAGIIFGFILQQTRVNTFNKIAGFAILKDMLVPKLLLTAIGVGSFLLFLEIQLGMASLHIKPFILIGIVVGGILFGIGMAILGYCPGTLIVSIGEGALDAFVGLIGGLLGGWLFTLIFPGIQNLLGPNLGKINLYFDGILVSGIIVLIYAIILLVAAFYLNRVDERISEE